MSGSTQYIDVAGPALRRALSAGTSPKRRVAIHTALLVVFRIGAGAASGALLGVLCGNSVFWMLVGVGVGQALVQLAAPPVERSAVS